MKTELNIVFTCDKSSSNFCFIYELDKEGIKLNLTSILHKIKDYIKSTNRKNKQFTEKKSEYIHKYFEAYIV